MPKIFVFHNFLINIMSNRYTTLILSVISIMCYLWITLSIIYEYNRQLLIITNGCIVYLYIIEEHVSSILQLEPTCQSAYQI